mmetsp:Transcript_31569/g.69560  ORF Transcript_31569/g.69560 Transcript_31569/m.69560 type:complete len:124 (+) Transcript_31569:468-839(+)
MAFYPENSETGRIVSVPPGHVWLLGDNCDNSRDSRSYGAVPVGMLQGRVFLKMGLRPHVHIVGIDTAVHPRKEVLSRNDSFNLTRQGEDGMQQLAKLRELVSLHSVLTSALNSNISEEESGKE